MSVMKRQRQLRQLGMIRLGFSKPGRTGGKIPQRSDTIILTSPDRNTLEAASKLFGGDVKDFPNGDRDKFSLVTKCSEIAIGVTEIAPTQWMEYYNKGTLQVRCDGCTVHGPRGSKLVDKPCLCAIKFPEPDARYEAVKNREACKIVTRVSVMIPDVPDIGVWRLDTRGEHAADELMMTLEVIQAILRNNPATKMVPCFLAIEQRKNADKQPYPVPVIRLPMSFNEITKQVEAGEEQRRLSNEQKALTDGGQRQLSPPSNPDDPDGVFNANAEENE